MPNDEDVFRDALIGKNIPLLTLDNQWHKLFTQTGENDELRKKEDALNELLKKQGGLNMEIKSLSSYKKKLMQEIVSIMELPDSDAKEKKMQDNKTKIEEINQQLEQYNDELLELPKLINEANINLMLSSMELCYEKLKQNTRDIGEINKWISAVRIQLKKKLLLKQKKEIWNNELYTYMHDIFGPDVIEMFDMKYDPENVLNKEPNKVE